MDYTCFSHTNLPDVCNELSVGPHGELCSAAAEGAAAATISEGGSASNSTPAYCSAGEENGEIRFILPPTTFQEPQGDHVGLDWLRDSVPGEPGVNYPIYSYAELVSRGLGQFDCTGRRAGGYYADPSYECQVRNTDQMICSMLE